MDLYQELTNNNILLLLTSKENYHSRLIEILKASEKAWQKICYVCANEPYKFVVGNIEKNSITADNFFFIDTLTRNVEEPAPVENCVFIPNPNSLTEISISLSNAFKEKGCDSTLFDTLSAFLIYESPHSIIQFVHGIVTKLRLVSGKGAFIALKEDIDTELIKDLYMFVDKAVDLESQK